MEFQEFPKIARLSRECVVTEKIDGTNAQVFIVAASEAPEVIPVPSDMTRYVLAVNPAQGLLMLAGSRSRYIIPEADNHGWAAWVKAHADDLWALGTGRHYGEWWGSGIQRGYGLHKGEKRFSLFNVARWHHASQPAYVSVSGDPRIEPKLSTMAPSCCSVVPIIYRGEFDTGVINGALTTMRNEGSLAAPGFKNPEGIVCYHVAANLYFKKTLEKDAEPKTRQREREVVA